MIVDVFEVLYGVLLVVHECDEFVEIEFVVVVESDDVVVFVGVVGGEFGFEVFVDGVGF
jgi:hypothetical protein